MEELNVKAGDKVIFHNSSARKIVTTVTKVTPTGRIRIALDNGSAQYDKYGYQMGGNIWYHTSISPYSEKEEKEIEEIDTISKAYNLMRSIKGTDITYDIAKKIIEILGELEDK